MTLATGIGVLEALEPEWTRLFERCPWATPFQHPGWLIAWARAFGGELWTATVRNDGELAAVLPVFVDARPEGRVAVPVGASVSDYLDVVAISPRAAAQALDAVLDGPFDRLDLPRTRADSPLAAVGSGTPAVPCPVLALPAHVDDLADVVSRSLYANLHKARRRAERDHGLALATWREPDDVARGIELLVRLHAARWEARGERGVLADPRVRQFHLEAAPALARSGMVRLHELALGGEPAAVLYALHHRGRSYMYLGGFDPAHDRSSTGSLVLLHAVEQAITERLSAFDMLSGREPYKYRWGAVDEPVAARTLDIRAGDVLWGQPPWESGPAPSTVRSRE